MTDSQESQRLAAASRQLVLGTDEAERVFGAAQREGDEQVEEWAHAAEWELGESFEIAWQETAEDDLQILDHLILEWGQMPDEEALLNIALNWGALIGERIIAAVGGSWVFRADPLHHSVQFPRQRIEFFPMHAVLARFLVGPQASLEAGYHQLVEFLTAS